MRSKFNRVQDLIKIKCLMSWCDHINVARPMLSLSVLLYSDS